MIWLLLFCIPALCSSAILEVSPLLGDALRVDLIHANGETIVHAVLCATLAEGNPTKGCDSDNMVREPLSWGPNTVVVSPSFAKELNYLVDVRLSSGEHCVVRVEKPEPRVETFEEEEEETDTIPWYYYSLVFIAGLFIAALLTAGVVVVWYNQRPSYTKMGNEFVNVYNAKKRDADLEKESNSDAYRLGLHRPPTLFDE